MAAKNLTIRERKEWAKTIYVNEPHITQKALAARVDVSENSIGKWIREGEWDKLRKNLLLTREEQLHKLLNELEELNNYIQTKNEGHRFADAKEADVRRKLIKDIKDLETKASIAETVSVCSRIVEWMSKSDLEKAKELASLFDSFIKHHLK
jgi:transposase